MVVSGKNKFRKFKLLECRFARTYYSTKRLDKREKENSLFPPVVRPNPLIRIMQIIFSNHLFKLEVISSIVSFLSNLID